VKIISFSPMRIFYPTAFYRIGVSCRYDQAMAFSQHRQKAVHDFDKCTDSRFTDEMISQNH